MQTRDDAKKREGERKDTGGGEDGMIPRYDLVRDDDEEEQTEGEGERKKTRARNGR